MIFYIAADHRGFAMKASIAKYLRDSGYEVADLGPDTLIPDDDYPDYASKVAEKISSNPEGSRGIVICGSGVGVDIVANKYPRVRCSLVMTPDQAFLSRNDDDANMIALSSDLLDDITAKTILATWLQTSFSGEDRHQRRILKIHDIEIRAKDLN